MSSIEASFKAQLALILDLVLRLPTNTLLPGLMSQGGDKGGSLKVGGAEKANVVGKVFSRQIPTSIPLKHVQTMATTTTSIVNVDMPKLQ